MANMQMSPAKALVSESFSTVFFSLQVWVEQAEISPGRHCHSTLSLPVSGCHSLGNHILILLSLLSLSVKIIVLPTASAELIAIQSHKQTLPRRTAKCLQPSLRGRGVRRTCST